MNRVIFLYDSLMNPKMQELARIPMKFLSYGYIRAKMYWFNDDKRRRYFAVPPIKKEHSRQYNTYIYGGIYIIEDYDEYKNALFAFYNSGYGLTNVITDMDMYVPVTTKVTPISFTSLEEFDKCLYKTSTPIRIMTMFGNEVNPTIQKSITKGGYYRHMRGIDAVSFLASLEKQNGR